MKKNKTAKAAIRVSHERWVHRNQLKQGMYVVELDKPWEDTPFLYQGFFLDNPELIEAVQQECEYVLIQEHKSALINRVSPIRCATPAAKSTTSYWNTYNG